ncbi:hypothetical protein Patl1_06433 [Pistacia atlantica]|uniref:Uncharacterized protein n=1 Tax=Pistacia atlantica TaxID=434234 RepID=A0ACC1BP36_9ROSI|nr:hypothetical protein Patl1_06433 [Pistacia atlantica]
MLNFYRFSKNKEQDSMDPVSSDGVNTAEDWITGKDVCLEDYGTSDWMALDPPASNTMLLGSASDEVEELGEGFDDYEIFNGEEENVDDNPVSQ